MPITGNDKMSLKILEELKKGTKIKEIPLLYPVSLDQAKRLSRYYKILQAADKHLSIHDIEKIQMLGLRILFLAPLFKDEDWEVIREILGSANEKTTRKELPLLMQAIEEKRKRMAEFNSEIDLKLKVLEKRENEVKSLKQDIQRKQELLDEKIGFLKKYPVDIQLFLLKHLGIYENKLVLARRLDSGWQNSLKKKVVLRYDDLNYVWYVENLDKMVEDYQKRIHRKNPSSTEWDYEKEEKRNQHSKYPLPTSPIYRLPNGLAQDLRSSIEAVEREISEIEAERKFILKEIKKLRKTSPKSFMESVEARNSLSVKELKLHGELQDQALKWLFKKDFVVSSEVLLPNGKRCDVIGYNEQGHIVIIEVKVSKADFQQDKKWISYLDYCNEFYFLTNEEASSLYYAKEECKDIGLLEETKKGLHIREPFSREQQVKDQAKVQFAVNKSLSRKFVFGY